MTERLDKKIGKFQVTLTVKEFVDTGEHIELQPIGDYQESCWNWDGAKDSIIFFIKRIEERLKDKD
ncbi:hypothetical protein LCGC14_1988410 [marine sediment metagenome]|uniref:Uncharacterized protein n=1 Tax=marine sediment metagenome TaxID=412755 RepID=A0A0F9HK64_9ZZZZ